MYIFQAYLKSDKKRRPNVGRLFYLIALWSCVIHIMNKRGGMQ